MARIVAADCPKCGAGLSVGRADEQVQCPYCGTTSFVQRGPGAGAAPPGVATIVITTTTSTRSPLRTIVLLSIAAAFAIGLAVIVPAALSGTSVAAGTREEALARLHDPAAAPRTEHRALEVCLCRTDLDGDGTNETTAQIAANVSELGDGERLTTYWIDITGGEPWYLPVGERTAPPVTVTGNQIEMYVACRATTLAIASRDVVTGWDLAARSQAWSTPLGGRYTSDLPDPDVAAGQFNFQCTRVEGGNPEVFEVPTEHGPVRVRMSDGMVVR